jgi:ankyrin repeat protein
MKHLLLTTIAAILLLGCAATETAKNRATEWPKISIHNAAAKGNIDVIKKYIALGTDINAIGPNRHGPLVYAIKNNHLKTAKFLINNGADVNAKTPKLKSRRLALQTKVPNKTYGVQPLHFACYENNHEMVKFLINNGADVNGKDSDGSTPLYASIRINSLAMSARIQILKGEEDNISRKYIANLREPRIVMLLVLAGADVNNIYESKTNDNKIVNKTYLDIAKLSDLPLITNLLLKHGAKTYEKLKAEGK